MKKLKNIILILLAIASLFLIAATIFIGTAMGSKASDFDLTKTKSNCKLSDGRYKVVYDKEFSGLEYEVKSDTIREIYQDNSVISVIEWTSDNEYFLSDLASHLTYKDDLNKELYTHGRPFYRLIKCGTDTIGFKLMRNQNNTVNTGALIKIN